MKKSRTIRQLRIAAGVAAVIVFAAAVVLGLQRAGAAQAEAEISLDAPVSFPVDI